MTSLIAFNVIPATLGVAIAFAAGLLILDRLGWKMASSHLRSRTAHHPDKMTSAAGCSRLLP